MIFHLAGTIEPDVGLNINNAGLHIERASHIGNRAKHEALHAQHLPQLFRLGRVHQLHGGMIGIRSLRENECPLLPSIVCARRVYWLR